jgi:DNA-binding response OmpR family regulator/DNA-binding CsgD family transcriptional regulator
MQPDAERDIVLIVDDVPENLAVLSDALDGAGYIVLVAEDGQRALDRLNLITPGIILLDAVMPGIDGFETCRRIKAMPAGRNIPVVFMTGLTETEHIVRGFMAGGIDYVTKPIKPEEVLARIAAHLRNARLVIQTQEAIDAAGLAVAVVNRGGNFLWQTPKARDTLELFAPTPDDQPYPMPAGLREWVRANIALAPVSTKDEKPFTLEGRDGNMLVVHFLGGMSGNRYLLLVENQRTPRTVATPLAEFRLTSREAEVLSWVAKGKTNRDIGDILKLSPRTVNKHLEHIYVKLGVETRTAAAALAMSIATSRE